ncbi:MAG: PD40 domain-containing protein, partial [Flavobacteriales bacterium]|nr:PD40 domain-containing protein [Flavobacteriales bacterium]
MRFRLLYPVILIIFTFSCKNDESQPTNTTANVDPIIYFSSNNSAPRTSALFSINSDGNNKIQLDYFPSNLEIRELDYCPATKKIVYTSTDSSSSDIFTINLDGSNNIPITNDTIHRSHPKFSSDGSKILFLSVDFPSGTRNAFIMNSDGSNIFQIPRRGLDIWDADWSPDDQKIIFTGGKDIYSMNIDGSELVKLTNDTLYALEPQISPDGAKVTFGAYSILNTEHVDLYKMDLDGKNLINLSNFETKNYFFYVRNLNWSKNGKKVVFTSDKDRNIRDGQRDLFVTNSDGSGLVKLDTLIG